jgi:hypothetical protein
VLRAAFLVSLASARQLLAALASPLPLPAPFPTGRASLTIYHVRDDVGASAPIVPDALLTFKAVKISVSSDPAILAAAAAAVDAARAEARGPGSALDARWGMRFATATSRDVHSVYCDAAGRDGQIDGRPVTFANGSVLVDYLTKNFGPA